MDATWSGSESYPFSHQVETGPIAHDVYVKGYGPPILILQELPGVGPETFELADRLIATGFTVYLPHLLGRWGKAGTLSAALSAVRLFCVRREFNMFLTGEQSPIAGWMRALCADISVREGGARVGVIGMCLTGSFVIPLMAEDAVIGAVASQPALPFRHSTQLHMSSEDVAGACAAMDDKGPALAMRYSGDPISSPAHLAALAAAFGDRLETEEYPSGGRRDHSLLTLDFNEAAYARTEAYFRARFGLDDR